MFERFGVKQRAGGDGFNDLSTGDRVHLVLYMTDRCGYCRIVFKAADSLGVNLEYRNVLRDSKHLQGLISLTGRRTVPCLLVNGESMFESARISEWLHETFSGSTIQ
jgi:glutaredoxin 3